MARRHTSAAEASAHLPQPIPAGPAIDIDELMPGLRPQHDGWNRDRVQRFLDALAHTGCVEDAAWEAGAIIDERLKRPSNKGDDWQDLDLDAIDYDRMEGDNIELWSMGGDYDPRPR